MSQVTLNRVRLISTGVLTAFFVVGSSDLAGAQEPPTAAPPLAAPEPVTPPVAAPPPPPPPPPPAASTPAITVGNPLDNTKTEKTDISGVPGQGLTVKVNDAFSLNIRTRIQGRYQLSVPQPANDGERHLDQIVNIGTARVYFSGNVIAPELTYVIQLAIAGRDYRDGATSPIFDAYLDYKAHRDVNIQAGQFFVPFDRLRTVREWGLQMADRPRPVQELTLDRDTGIVLYSDKFLGDKSPLAYRIGAFGGGGTNLITGRRPGGLFVGRLELRPLGAIDDDREGDLERRAKPALALGGAFAANINSNRQRSTTGTTYVGGTADFLHIAADLTFKWSGFALQAEYLWKKADKDVIYGDNADGEQIAQATRSAHGWVLQASYIFPTPVEIVGRLSRLYALSGTDPSLVSDIDKRGQEVAAGINYYVNGHRFKFQADWIARVTPKFEKPDHLIHAQFDATF